MKPKFFLTTTFARTITFFQGQARKWNEVFDVTAISAEKEKLVAFAQGEGINYKYLPMHREISISDDIICFLKFFWLFVKERPYVVHGNTPKASLLSMSAAWLTYRPVRIYMCHGLRYQTETGILRKILMTMEWISCHCATHVIGVSQGVCNQLVKDGLCSARKAKVVGNGTVAGIDIEYFSRDKINGDIPIREKLGILCGDFVFCFVGRIVKDKGINELVSAFHKLSNDYGNCHLLLIGAQEKDLDPISEDTEKLINSNNHIYAVGRQNDVRPWVTASNVIVLPSYREGVGMVLLEANALGIPCIASDIIGCNDVIREGINGELVAVHNTEKLYDKMKDWYLHPEKVELMASNCRNYVTENFDARKVKEAYYQEYLKITKLV